MFQHPKKLNKDSIRERYNICMYVLFGPPHTLKYSVCLENKHLEHGMEHDGLIKNTLTWKQTQTLKKKKKRIVAN